MAKSQLKQFKATLKAHGLTGQSNGGKKQKSKRREAKEYDREEKEQLLDRIRAEFNPFEVKATKSKHKSAKIAVGKPGISKQVGEEQRRRAYEARNAVKNKQGGVLDRRFGERDKKMTEEEKMLERFTRERLSQSKGKRRNIFNLEDDQDDMDDIMSGSLTHLGQSLDFEGDLSSDGGLREAEPPRKKTKTEVMQEIIAKSKYYKHERQKAQQQMETQIESLDDNFEDIMSELRTTQAAPAQAEDNDINKEYDVKVKELLLEKRAVPSDRTKTDEELAKEAEDKMKKLEQQRLDRMQGMLEAEDEDVEKGVEDLDDGFWSQDDDADMDQEIADSDDDIKFLDEHDTIEPKVLPNTSIPCPATHKELLLYLKQVSLTEHPKYITAVIKAYQPKLAEGNKDRLGKFSCVILEHIIFLAANDYSKAMEAFAKVQNSLLAILKKMSHKYNSYISQCCRDIVQKLQADFKTKRSAILSAGTIIFLTIVGILFSTSDQYHLVATPCSIFIAEMLEQIKFNTVEKLAFGTILVRLELRYQRLSKRYIPEVTNFFHHSLTSFLNDEDFCLENETLFAEEADSTLSLSDIFNGDHNDETFRKIVLTHILQLLDTTISSVWKNTSAFQEIVLPIEMILKSYNAKYPTLKMANNLLDKIQRLRKFGNHTPLTLQHHKPTSIPSHAPKFEESFNPEKKSYDIDRTRQELNKVKAQIKKERKFTMKEIRKDTRFEARQRIEQKKAEAAQYHANMARIINTISTEEGAEKNKYERERRLRNAKK